MVPLLMTTVMRLIPPERRGQTMGTISIVIAVAPAVGPTLSGFILGSLNWRWTFWAVLPIAVGGLLAGLRRLHVADEREDPNPIDPVSVPLSALAFAGLVFGLSELGSGHGEQGVPAWLPLTVGAVALLLFGRPPAASATHRPGLPGPAPVHLSALLGVRRAGGARVHGAVRAIIMVPLYVQNVLGQSALVAGLTACPAGWRWAWRDRWWAGLRPVRGASAGGARFDPAVRGAVWVRVAVGDHAGVGTRGDPDGHDDRPGADVHSADDRCAGRAAGSVVRARQRDHDDPAAGRRRGRHRAVRHGDGQGLGVRGAPDMPGVHAAFVAAAVVGAVAVLAAFFTANEPSPAGGPVH
jgi:DHA2 family lincomycin resistance protein-like MFS transporter